MSAPVKHKKLTKMGPGIRKGSGTITEPGMADGIGSKCLNSELGIKSTIPNKMGQVKRITR